MSCNPLPPFYIPPTEVGLKIANSQSDGQFISLEWNKAYPQPYNYIVGYNIYFSSIKEDLFTEGPKYLAVNTLAVDLNDFIPGDTYFFAVRATQWSPDWIDFNSMPANVDGYYYPEAFLLQNFGENDTSIFLSDIDNFPNFGIIQVGGELIYYQNKDLGNSSLTGLTRGFLGTNIRSFDTTGYDGYTEWDPFIKIWHGVEEKNVKVFRETCDFAYPHFAYTSTDGYYNNPKDHLNTNLTNSDNELSIIPSFDFSGYRSTNPADLYQGKCVGSYFGGEIGCASDGYNLVPIRGGNVNDENLKRQELVLEQTARLGVLLQRSYTGIRCSCVMATSEHPDDRCHFCFAPGTLVKTEDGWRKIEEININDKVLTEDGTYKKVLKTMKSLYNGDLLSILNSSSSNPILVTPDHLIKTVRGKHKIKLPCGPKCNNYIRRGDGVFSHNPDIRQLISGKWSARITINNKRKNLGTFITKELAEEYIYNFKKSYFKPGHELVWDSADQLKENDWLVNIWSSVVKDIDYIQIPQEFQKNTDLGSQRNGSNSFILDEDFCWVIGFYLAEGSSSKRSIQFSTHKNESQFHHKLISIFRKYEFDAKLYSNSENGLNVCIHSTSLANWFPIWLGLNSSEKKIPEELMNLPNNKLNAILNGINDGDGTKRKTENEITTVSEILSLQISEILHKLGYQPLIRSFIPKILTPKGNQRKQVYLINWELENNKKENRKFRWKFKNENLSQIKKINKINYNGYVYNLEIESNHTYVVQNILVHNCIGTGYLLGFQQYFNPRRSDGRILVSVEPTEEDIPYSDLGLENTLSPNAWTLAVPQIKDRDIIIFYDTYDSNLEDARFEVLNVSRNRVLYGVQGSQRLKLRRIRKTDAIYKISVNKNTSSIPSTLTTSITMAPGILPHSHQVIISGDNTLSITSINQLTQIGGANSSQYHNHQIINGIVQPSVGDGITAHTHTLIFP